MLKETETKETSLFFHLFVIGGISIGGGRAPWDTTPWLRLWQLTKWFTANKHVFNAYILICNLPFSITWMQSFAGDFFLTDTSRIVQANAILQPKLCILPTARYDFLKKSKN